MTVRDEAARSSDSGLAHVLAARPPAQPTSGPRRAVRVPDQLVEQLDRLPVLGAGTRTAISRGASGGSGFPCWSSAVAGQRLARSATGSLARIQPAGAVLEVEPGPHDLRQLQRPQAALPRAPVRDVTAQHVETPIGSTGSAPPAALYWPATGPDEISARWSGSCGASCRRASSPRPRSARGGGARTAGHRDGQLGQTGVLAGVSSGPDGRPRPAATRAAGAAGRVSTAGRLDLCSCWPWTPRRPPSPRASSS